MLTRDKEQIMLNDIHTLCIEAADHYRAALSKECVADMKPIFEEAADERQRFAAELAACIRSHDDQPKLPDPDRETLDLFFTSIKAQLATSERETLLNDQAKLEEKLRAAVDASLQSKLPLEIKPLLEQISARSIAMLNVLHNRQ